MLTCFIRTDFPETSQTVTLMMFLTVPFCFIIYSTFLCFRMCCNKKLHMDIEMSNLFYKYIIFISVYFLFNAPMCLLYILTLKRHIERNTFLSWLSFVRLYIILVFLLHDVLCESRSNCFKIDPRICKD